MSTVADVITQFQEVITEYNPNADTSPGSVLSELLLKLAANISVNVETQISDIQAGSTISTVLASTTPTYNSAVDALASNYNVVRVQGVASTGNVQIFVSVNRSYLLPTTFTLVQPSLGLMYSVTASYTVDPTATVNSGTTLALITNGTAFYFILPVVATVVGTASQLSNGTVLNLASTTNFPNFVSATAYGNFTSGVNEESDQVLIPRFQAGLNYNVPVNADAITNFLTAKGYTINAVSVVGAQDPEMTRSKNNIMGISTFGMADVYLRTSIGANSSFVTETGTKVSTGVWTLTISNTDAPAFYEILSIVPGNSTATNVVGLLNITDTNFGFVTPTSNQNVIAYYTEARFSAYQNCVVTFDYTEPTTLPVGSTLPFIVQTNASPNIAPIQALFLSNSTRIACADYLIKGVIPCFVSLSLNIHQLNPSTPVPVTSIQQAIYNYINSIPFGASIYISEIVAICHSFPIKSVDLPILAQGTIYLPNGGQYIFSNEDILTIPNLPSEGVTVNTCMFFIDYFTTTGSTTNSNIGITVV